MKTTMTLDETYPSSPGWKGQETSQAAAQSVAVKAKKQKQQVLESYRGAAMTPDECAELLRPQGMSDVLFETFKRGVRSRTSELSAAGKVFDTGVRRPNASGHPSIVWSAAMKQGNLL